MPMQIFSSAAGTDRSRRTLQRLFQLADTFGSLRDLEDHLAHGEQPLA
jgi:hypothetical protein